MNTNPARGMRDFLPDDVRRREYVMGVIADVYQRYGYEPLETPSVENIETLLGKYGEEGDRLIFRILKRGEEGKTGEADLALRYDLTVPLARVIAEYRAQLPKFFKRYQMQPVWRADRPQKGRFREFYQCDVDAMGSTSPVVDAELCAAVSDVLTRLGFTQFDLVINHRGLLSALILETGVPQHLRGEALVALDKFDKVGAAGVGEELLARGLAEAATARLLEWLEAAGQRDGLQWIRKRLSEDNAAGREALDNLQEIVRLAGETAAGPHLRFQPSLARGLSYYTGAIFEIKVPDLAGSLGGGGRYDNLVGMFLGQQVPATGFSLGLERILVVMTERGMFPDTVASRPADVMVTIWNADRTTDAVRLAGELRAAGLRTDIYPDADKIGKQFKYADSRGIPFVTVVGDDEAAGGRVAVKNLKSGEQTTVLREEVAQHIRSLIPSP
jgi:histidyl-tRNA synthetase